MASKRALCSSGWVTARTIGGSFSNSGPAEPSLEWCGRELLIDSDSPPELCNHQMKAAPPAMSTKSAISSPRVFMLLFSQARIVLIND
jgi:hypothetical protein